VASAATVPRLYPSWANLVYWLALLALLAGAASLVIGPMLYVRTAYNTSQFQQWPQPVEFDHRHHVRDNGIECLYCHASAERSSSAGVPTTAVCMGCHSQIWQQSPLLEVVRRSYFSGQPIAWRRVHQLPGFVYFDHSVHVQHGFACDRCHGDVGGMARVTQLAPLTMNWCLDCHRDPEAGVGSERITDNTWAAAMRMIFKRVANDRRVTLLTTCTTCHR
jgi:hypothetical protein